MNAAINRITRHFGLSRSRVAIIDSSLRLAYFSDARIACRFEMRKRLQLALLLMLFSLALTACGGGGNGSTDNNPPGTESAPESLQETLNLLGVDTTATPRQDEQFNDIDESYAPMGRRISMMKIDNGDGTTSLVQGIQQELFIAGMRTANCLTNDCDATLIDDAAAVANFDNSPSILYRRSESSPWIAEDLGSNDFPETLRAATGADVDGDGRREVVLIYLDPAFGELHVSIADVDAPGAPTEDIVLPLEAALFPIADLRVATGNFDNDSEEEFVIGIGSHATAPFNNARAYIVVVDGQSQDYAIISQIEIAALDPTRSISLVLEAAQLDYDGAMELVVIQNERGASPINVFDPETMANNSGVDAEAYYTVFDLVGATIEATASGYIEANIVVPPGMALQTRRALVADVAVGDSDNDSLDEIWFAGFSDMSFSGNCNPVGHLLVSLDDQAHQFRLLSEAWGDTDPHRIKCPDFSGWKLHFAYLNMLDIDGDGNREIQFNQFVLDAAPQGHVDWYDIAAYDAVYLSRIMFREFEGNAFFDRSNSAIVTGDVTGDGREDIISYLQGEADLRVFGVEKDTSTLSRVAKTAIEPSLVGQIERINPIVIPLNADSDTTVYDLTGHEYVVTEPIVLGVLAAPPCQIGIGQNLDGCTTTWGQSSSIGIEREKGFNVSAGVNVGFSADTQSCAGVGYSQCTTIFEVEVKASLEVALARMRSEAYELTKSIAFTTGPIEDSVVFGVVPIDTYYYSRLNLAEDILTSGDVDLVVSLPREPVILMTEVSYFNQSMLRAEDRIPDDVFQHRAGNIDTYPSAQQANNILSDRRSQLDDVRIDRFALFNPVFDDDAPLDALEGLEVGPVGVGQGSGSTELGLDLARNDSLSVTHEVNFSLEVNVAAGPGTKLLAGYTIGAGVSHTLNVSKGSSTSYLGTVGSIDAAHFPGNQYQFGLFTYLQANPETGREFEVINYWVE